MDDTKAKELNDRILSGDIKCGVFLADKATLCNFEAIDVIMIGDVKPPALLPICQYHGTRLETGNAFLIMELDGGRNFAIQFGDGTTPVQEDIMGESQSEMPPINSVKSPSA